MKLFLRCCLILGLTGFVGVAMALAGSYKNGTVIKVQGASEIYYYINGYAAHVPTPKIMICMGLEKHKTESITQAQLKGFPETEFLVRGSDGKIYLIDGNYRRHFPSQEVFRKRGFNERQVIQVRDSVLQCIPEGTPLR